MHILKRPTGDEFTFRLFVRLVNSYKLPKDVFYLWSPCIDPQYQCISKWVDGTPIYEDELTYRTEILSNIKSDTVIIGIKDHLTSHDFNPWLHTKPDMVLYLEDMFNYYSNKKFILFTTLENLNHYIKNPRVSVIPWGGDIVNGKTNYQRLDVIVEKNFDSDYNFLSLNRGLRPHRAFLVSLLHGLKIETHGLISCMFRDKITDVFAYLEWPFTDEQQDIYKIVSNGYVSVNKSHTMLKTTRETSGTYPDSANTVNFKSVLLEYYRDTFIEIITETSCTEMSFNLTEKTLHSIYGQSFPIFISSPGIVKFLREMGMDVFDDIVDHSYDTIENPIDRIYQAITSNKSLLTDNTLIKKLWKDNQHRFIKNIDFAKTRMYNFYSQRTIDKFNECTNL